MSDIPGHDSKNSTWLIHKREERLTRLKSLADSINDSARMARATLSLLLLLALYLSLTLLVSTDENLLVNSRVALPQTGVGISIVQSYIFAPPIFLYLHIQTLYLMSVLARKVQTYESVLMNEIPDEASQDGHSIIMAEWKECWDWLSAFAFVQLFRRDNESLMPAVLASLSTIVIPLLLLFAIALSFVRYQSLTISLSHHIFFLLDLFYVELFRRRTLKVVQIAMPKFAIDMVKVAWSFCALFLIIMIFNALPPQFKLENVEQDRDQIWPERKADKKNLVDAITCYGLQLYCRYLDVSNKHLAKIKPEDLDLPIDNLILKERSFRFGKFNGAQLTYVNFDRANLQGSTLEGAELEGVNLESAKLQGANLKWAKAQSANLSYAWLEGADLSYTQLKGADLSLARLKYVNLKSAQMQGAELPYARLHGADLSSAQLQGAKLPWCADYMVLTYLSAQLQGAEPII